MEQDQNEFVVSPDGIFTVESTEQQTLKTAIGRAQVVGGLVLTGIGYIGIDTHEAQSPEEAIGSVTFGENDAFITATDVGYGSLGLLGAGLLAIGIRTLRRTR